MHLLLYRRQRWLSMQWWATFMTFSKSKHRYAPEIFFFARCCLGRSRAERPSVSCTKVTAKSQGQAISCKRSLKPIKQISGKMKRMREPWDRTHWRDALNERGRLQSSARGSIEAAEVHRDDEMRGWEGERKTTTKHQFRKGRPKS